MPNGDWAQLIADAAARVSAPVVAETFRRKFGTSSQPVVLTCDDGYDYVVKSRHAGRMIVTDQIVGRAGRVAGAPIGEPALVDVPVELINAEPEMAHMAAGVAHASTWIVNCSEQKGFEYTALPGNRDRFARLALVFGWMAGSDHQFIYANDPPHAVSSVDHGHFFPGSTGWTIATLQAAPQAAPDASIVSACALTQGELDRARADMTRISDEEVALAVACPRDEWGVTADERIAVAIYLAAGRDVIFGAEEGEEP